MITWRDEGILLSVRQHGETSAIVDLFTRDHGRHAGVVRGGISRRIAPILQPGAQLAAAWSARIEDHIGSFTVEPLRARADALESRVTVAGLSAVLALLTLVLPERDPHPGFHDRSAALLDLTSAPDVWPLAYLQWELALLDELGFGLELGQCAVTGTQEDLVWVSPRSGRAVSRAAGAAWANRLLALPPVMRGTGVADGAQIAAALGTTGWFIEHRLLAGSGGRPLPAARSRLVAAIAREA